MLKSYLIAALGIAALMAFWALVQQLWRQVFFPGSTGENVLDVLEHRRGCGRCGCVAPCSREDIASEEEGRVSLKAREVGQENR
ncbi:MAG: hypothetical protein ACFB9M_10030 [Myxococcota bacterium]